MANDERIRVGRVLITGGAGFLGQALVRELRRPDGPIAAGAIRLFDRRPAPAGEGVEVIQGDIREAGQVARACEGVDVVFHCAAIVDWGHHPEEVLWAINVGGTDAVIQACRASGVRVLVHTSSEDAVLSDEPIRQGDERIPYPRKFLSAYCESKARSEQAVVAANGAGLSTAVMRPGGIYGEGDPYHISSLIHMARRGALLRVGDGSAQCQHVYVGNVAHAHLLAARALLQGNPAVPGQVYFITDSPPCNFFDFLAPIVEGAGYRVAPRAIYLPYGLMYGLGAAMEAAAWLLKPVFRFTPLVSRFGVRYVCQDFTFSSDKARRDFGYTPVYSVEEAVARSVAHFREHGPGPVGGPGSAGA